MCLIRFWQAARLMPSSLPLSKVFVRCNLHRLYASLPSDTDMAEAGTDVVEEAPAEFATYEEQATQELMPDRFTVDAIAAQPPAPATATSFDSDEIRPDASRLDLKAHDTVTDMLPQPADEPNHVPCSCISFDNMKDDLMGANSTDDRETCDSADIKASSHTPGIEAPSLITQQHQEKLGQIVLVTEAEERDGDRAATDPSDMWGMASAHAGSLPPTG